MKRLSIILISTIHLIHCEVDAGVRYDAQQVWDVALVERRRSLLLEDLFGTVENTRVLARLAER